MPAEGRAIAELATGERLACAPFEGQRLQRQLAADAAAGWAMVAGLVAALLATVVLPEASQLAANAIFLAVLVLWMVVNLRSAQIVRQLPQITAALEEDPAGAEAQLAWALRRRALLRSVRLLLYQRLALLRHRQNRCAETGAICQALLAQEHRVLRPMRAGLLLMLAESQLACQQFLPCYEALRQLSGLRLNLLEVLQKLLIQTRYEVGVGQWAAALQKLKQKVAAAELMPAAQCGTLHALLALAARRAGRQAEGEWLGRRAELLCEERQLAALGLTLAGEAR